MSQLLAMSFDSPASPSITLKGVSHAAGQAVPYGWGFAWYPAGDYAALVIKDPTSIGDNAMTKVLRDWDRFQATVFVCHVTGAAQRRTQEDTHPFSRSFAGRDWVIAHSGTLAPGFADKLALGVPPAFEPIGHTDTEWLFCWLLNHLQARNARRLADVSWGTLHGWLKEINVLGSANILFTDGQDVVVYHDNDCFNGLWWVRSTPPHSHMELENQSIQLDLGDFVDVNRTRLLFSTEPLSDDDWQPMQGGQMMVVRRAAVMWDSAAPSANGTRDLADPSSGSHLAAGQDVTAPSSPTPAATLAAVDDAVIALAPPTRPAVPVGEGLSGELTPGAAEQPRRHGASIPEKGRLLSLSHITRYTYQRPVERSTHVFRLHPINVRGQEILKHSLEISTEAYRREYDDVFGNRVTRLVVERPFNEMVLESRALIRLRPELATWHSLTRRRVTIPLVWMPWQRQMMLPYLLPPELPETQLRELSDFAMSFVARNDYDLLDTMVDMNMTIYRDFSYISGSTSLQTTPFDVYIKRHGVCQDFANLLICLARLLNVPARYMVGYIYTGGDYENKVQSDASHAWVELYLPWVGWCGLDPTNGCLVSTDHIRVAYGRNYRDATPTSGTIFSGGAGETMTVEVQVNEVEEAATDASPPLPTVSQQQSQ